MAKNEATQPNEQSPCRAHVATAVIDPSNMMY